jgi:hypothetical protein
LQLAARAFPIFPAGTPAIKKLTDALDAFKNDLDRLREN